MSGQNDKPIQSTGQHRVLNFGAVRVHNRHLQSGRQTGRGCGVCEGELEGFMALSTGRDKSDEMAPGDGANEKGDSSLAPGDRNDTREYEYQVLERETV